MRVMIRRGGLVLTTLAAATVGVCSLPAAAQTSPPAAASADEPAPKQVPLTQKIIDQLVATQKAIHDSQAKAPKNQDPKAAQAKVEQLAKSNGFATPQDFANASYSVGAVIAGMDETGNFIGVKAATQKQIDEIKADKKMPANEKKEALEELNETLKSADTEKPSQGNIDLVKTNAAKLSESAGGDD